MSSYGSSYISRFGSGRNSASPASSTSSVDRSKTPSTYGSLPRTYGSTRTSADCRSPTRADSGRTYGTSSSNYGNTGSSYGNSNNSTVGRYTPRSYSTDRSTERPKSPERTKYTPLETSALRMGSSSRFGGQIARSPISDKTPNVFGISPVSEMSPTPFGSDHGPSEPIQVTLVTRSTSPTPPCNSSFLRARRADMDRLDVQTVSKPNYRPVCITSETQTDDGKKPTAWGSRIGGGSSNTTSSSSTSSAAARGYRGYIRPGDLPVTKKEEPPPPLERKDVVSRVGGLSLARPTDLPLTKTPSFIRGDTRSPSYKSPSTSFSEMTPKSEPRSPGRTPDQEIKSGVRLPSMTSVSESKAPETRNFLISKPPDPPFRSPSKLDLKASAPKTDSSTSSKSVQKDLVKSPSKKNINNSISKNTPETPSPGKLKKSTTTTAVLPLNVPNKDFRKSVLNMGHNKKPVSSSSESSSSEETSSEDSSDEEEPRSNDSRYLTASRTTAQMSSADEVSSLSMDKQPPKASKPPVQKEETKTVTVKTTTTATPMKVRFGASEGNVVSEKDEPKKVLPLRRFDSGQKDWWLSSGSDGKSSGKPSRDEQPHIQVVADESSQNDEGEKHMYKLRKFDSGQADWWKSSKDIPSQTSSQEGEIGSPQGNVANDSSSSSYKKLTRAPSSASIGKSGVSLHNIPSSVNLDKSETPPQVNLNKTPSSSSLHKSPSSISLPKAPSDLSLQQTGSVSSLPTDDVKSASPSKPSLVRTRSSASLQKTGSNVSLQRANSNASLPKIGSNGSLEKSGSSLSLQKSGSNLSLRNSGSESNLKLPETTVDVSKSGHAGGVVQKTPSNVNVSKTSSSTNLAAKPPINLSRSDSRETLEAKEHTPGFKRLHKRYNQLPRRLVRVESGERDWWLSDEEKSEQKKQRPSEELGRVYCGLFTNIDHVLGSQAPPPAAFRTPEHSSDDDSSDEEFWKEVKPSEVKVHEPTVQPDGMIKVFTLEVSKMSFKSEVHLEE